MGKMIEQGLDIELPVFEIESENRIMKLWELASKIPMTDETRTKLIEEVDIKKRYELLNNYVHKIIEMKF